MSRILNYVADLFHESWAIIGALSLIGFFIPRLNDYTPFILAVATVALMTAGYKLHQRQISDQEDKIRTLSLQHASQVSAITRQHEMILTQSSTRISELEAEVADLRRPKFTEETRQIAERAYRDLKHEHKVVLRYTFAAGDMTDRQALQYLKAKGMAANWASVLGHLSVETPFVQRALQGRQYGEHVTGYEGNYVLNPVFRDVLEALLEGDPTSQP